MIPVTCKSDNRCIQRITDQFHSYANLNVGNISYNYYNFKTIVFHFQVPTDYHFSSDIKLLRYNREYCILFKITNGSGTSKAEKLFN